jgi:hypothetical protein
MDLTVVIPTGRFVWRSYDLECCQALAPDFFAAWEAAGDTEPARSQ